MASLGGLMGSRRSFGGDLRENVGGGGGAGIVRGREGRGGALRGFWDL